MNAPKVFLAVVLLLNILAFVYLTQWGLPEQIASGSAPFVTCLVWMAFNLLCFYLYKKMRPR